MAYDQPLLQITGAVLPIKDKIIVGAAGGDRGVRDWVAALDAATGKLIWLKYTIPAPGEPGSETWKDKNDTWRTGGGAVWVTGTYDPATHQTIWGVGNPVPMMDPSARPGDNLYTNSAVSYDPDTGKMNWYFQYTPNDGWDYDEVGTHILIDGQIAGENRKLITHSARNGFTYTMERNNGQIVAGQALHGQHQLDQGHRPEDRQAASTTIPPRTCSSMRASPTPTQAEPVKRLCPNRTGGNNYWPSSYSPKTKLLYIPAMTACEDVTNDRQLAERGKDQGWFTRSGGGYRAPERYESNLTAVDPFTGDVKKTITLRYPNYSGTLATGGGLIFLALMDGTVAAYDDTTLEEVWKINVGSGFAAPPMTFEVNGKQYIAIASGPSSAAKSKLINTPELKEQRHAMVLYVFGL